MARVKTSFWTRSLDKLRGTFLHVSPEPASPKVARKVSASTGTTTQSPTPGSQAETTGASATRADKAPKKKLPVQPWYRHRQRW